MRTHGWTRSAASALICFALAQAGARAAFGAESCIPADLALGLLGGEVRSLFVGDPAPELQAGIAFPADAVVIGGVSDTQRVTLIASVPRPVTQARDEMKGLLQAGGWKARDENRREGGFITRQHEQHIPYCGPDGSMLHFYSLDRPQGGSLLSVTRLSKTRVMGFCEEGARGGGSSHLADRGPMPTLEPPAGVELTYQGNGIGGRGIRTESVGMATDATPRDLASHFSGQLADQGWTLDADLVGDSMATQMWSLTDRAGKPWRGMLLIAILNEDSRDASFSIVPRD